ncbi:hypothetical protein Bbelb_042160 [Branchiostoma belcheri]|nr:hypothetical protein Bbelb_042160 [Branchiostoma belcheri]
MNKDSVFTASVRRVKQRYVGEQLEASHAGLCGIIQRRPVIIFDNLSYDNGFHWRQATLDLYGALFPSYRDAQMRMTEGTGKARINFHECTTQCASFMTPCQEFLYYHDWPVGTPPSRDRDRGVLLSI